MGLADLLRIKAIWTGNVVDYIGYRSTFIDVWVKYIQIQCEKEIEEGRTFYEAKFIDFIYYLDELFKSEHNGYDARLKFHFGDMGGREDEWYKRFLHPVFLKGIGDGLTPSLFKCDAREILCEVREKLEKENFKVISEIVDIPNHNPVKNEENRTKYQLNFVVDWSTDLSFEP